MSGAPPRIALDLLAEAAGLLEARLLLIGVLIAAAHHPRELVAVDVADGAELFDQLALLLARDDADRIRAGELAQLRGEHAEPARGAPDEDAVARLELAAVDEHPVRREVRQPVGGGVLPGEVLGLVQQLLRLNLAELGERAPARLIAPDLLARRGERVKAVDLRILVGGLVAVHDDLVAGLPAGHALADLPHDAGGVRAADVVILVGVIPEHGHRLARAPPTRC